MSIKIISFFFILFNLTDYITTYLALSNGGIEVNPIVSYLQYNLFNVFVFKFVIVIYIILLTHYVYKKSIYKKFIKVFYSVLTISFLIISINNLFWWLI